jgi:hypothetical protein
MLSFTQSSDLEIEAEEFLKMLTIEGVNAELRPIAQMTAPSSWKRIPIEQWPENQLLFNSWILLLGVFPIDLHFFTMQQVRAGKGFAEASSSIINKQWCHVREVTSIHPGCRVTDIVRYQSRLPFVGHLLKPIYKMVFRNRHRNLTTQYGGHALLPGPRSGERS